MHDTETAPAGRSIVSTRTMDIVVAMALLGVSAIVIFDATRLGFGWQEGEGPQPGYFPFYIAVILGFASVVNLYHAVSKYDATENSSFVSSQGILRVLSVLLPAIAFVAGVQFIGIYVSAAIFIFVFMILIGRENPLMALAVSAGVPLALFLLFERWFLVPLPKGPLEAMLGY